MTVSLKNYTFDSFRNICSDEGMIIEDVYGSYLGKPYEALDPRMIFFCGSPICLIAIIFFTCE